MRLPVLVVLLVVSGWSLAADRSQYSVDSIRHIVYRNMHNLGQLMEEVRKGTDGQTHMRRTLDELTNKINNVDTVVRHGGVASEDLDKLISRKMSQAADPFPRQTYPRDCSDVRRNGHGTSGVYTVYVAREVSERAPRHAVTAYCDMDVLGGGWTVLMSHIDDKYPFHERSWADYERGFGNLAASHWLGNNYTAALTAQGTWRLRVELWDYLGQERYAEYSYARVESADRGYRLVVSGYRGNAGDSLGWQHNGKRFTTYDRDNDDSAENCATGNGGWWYGNCWDSILTGRFYNGRATSGPGVGILWSTWAGRSYALRRARMLLRPADYEP